MMFGGRTPHDEGVEIIDKAIDAGINFIDTANVYNRGRSEECVGEAVTRRGRRDSLIIATKVHGSMDAEDPNAQGNSRRHIIQQCEASLGACRRTRSTCTRSTARSPTSRWTRRCAPWTTS